MASVKAIKSPRKTSAAPAKETASEAAFDFDSIRSEIEAELRRNVNEWLPRAVDEKGGFYQTFERDWKRPKKDEPRFVVYQARMTWLAATYCGFEPKSRKSFESFAQHGLAFLASRQWDADRGGFYDHVNRDGMPVTDGIGQVKSIYGNSFGVYALAAMYRATKDLFALDLAFEAFEWIDCFAHDDANGGYFNVVSLDGKRVTEGSVEAPDETKAPGIKTMNTHIHLLESFTELLRAAPHIVVRERVEQLLLLVRDKIATDDGYLVERLTDDWQPLSKTTSFGHDIETAFLLLDSAQAVGKGEDEQTHKVARSLVDHALKLGWNEKLGLLAYAADLNGKVTESKTNWWVSAEALNAFLLMHELYGAETDRYWIAFVAQWNFIKNHHLDAEHGGWFDCISSDGTPVNTHKAGQWKEAYHETRSMMHVVERLKRLSATAP
jgi:mannobiose 2-epimerase